jgi:hypothetical protein
VPYGYRVSTRPIRALVVSGSITFGTTYFASVVTAAGVLGGNRDNGVPLAPLFFPVVGPFVAIGTTKSSGVGTLWLVLDGIAQTGGMTLLMFGLFGDEKLLVRTTSRIGLAESLSHPDLLVGAGVAALRWKL